MTVAVAVAAKVDVPEAAVFAAGLDGRRLAGGTSSRSVGVAPSTGVTEISSSVSLQNVGVRLSKRIRPVAPEAATTISWCRQPMLVQLRPVVSKLSVVTSCRPRKP